MNTQDNPTKAPTAYFAARGTPQWNEAWDALGQDYPDRSSYDETSNEGWQYIGTFLHDEVWEHQFRHRCLNGVRTVLNYPSALLPVERELA